jgi:hypothetical protein
MYSFGTLNSPNLKPKLKLLNDLQELHQLLSNFGVVIWWLSNDNLVLLERALHLVVHQVGEHLFHLAHVLNSAANHRVFDIQELLL